MPLPIPNSSTGGYLTPVPGGPAPLEDGDLDDFLKGVVAGITALAKQYVQPRWQQNPPNEPPIDTNWCAVGVTRRVADVNAAILHRGDLDSGDGYDLLVRMEELHILASFYGPLADSYATLLRDGFSIAQNRETMFAAGFGFVEVEEIIALPDLRNQRWLQRSDVPFRLRRIIEREYAILNLLEADGTVTVQDVGDQLYPQTLKVTGP